MTKCSREVNQGKCRRVEAVANRIVAITSDGSDTEKGRRCAAGSGKVVDMLLHG